MDIGNMDVAAASMNMKQAQIAQKVDVAVMKNAMDSSKEIAGMLIDQLMGVSMAAGSGHIEIGV